MRRTATVLLVSCSMLAITAIGAPLASAAGTSGLAV